MKKTLGQEPVYDARELGVPRMLVLGLQHMFAMFGATVLVPILVQSYGLPLSIQTTLLMAGLGTLLFHVCTKLKVPAFLGSSFAYLGGFQAVASLDSGKYASMTGAEKLPYALGGIVVAGLLYLVLALLFKVVGPHRSEFGGQRCDQRLHQLVAGSAVHRHHHRGQHLGTRHDQDYSHSSGCGHPLHRGDLLQSGGLFQCGQRRRCWLAAVRDRQV